jgi:hypothetical protein
MCPDRRPVEDPSGPDPMGPEVMRPVGWRGIGPEDFLGIGPELGPDRTDPLLCWDWEWEWDEEEEGRDIFGGGGPVDDGSRN